MVSRSPKPLLPQSSVFPKHRHPVSQAQSSASGLAFSCSPHPICQQILTALTSNASGTIHFSSPALPTLLLLPDYAHASHSPLPPSRQAYPTNKQKNLLRQIPIVEFPPKYPTTTPQNCPDHQKQRTSEKLPQQEDAEETWRLNITWYPG